MFWVLTKRKLGSEDEVACSRTFLNINLISFCVVLFGFQTFVLRPFYFRFK